MLEHGRHKVDFAKGDMKIIPIFENLVAYLKLKASMTNLAVAIRLFMFEGEPL